MQVGAMNMVIMLGHLTRDFDGKYVGPNKIPLAKSGIAVNLRYKGSDGERKTETCFIEIEAWGALAGTLLRNFQKGDPILIRGRIRLNEWTDLQTKEAHRKHVIYIESFENIRDNDGRPSNDPESVFSN